MNTEAALNKTQKQGLKELGIRNKFTTKSMSFGKPKSTRTQRNNMRYNFRILI